MWQHCGSLGEGGRDLRSYRLRSNSILVPFPIVNNVNGASLKQNRMKTNHNKGPIPINRTRQTHAVVLCYLSR